MATRKRVEKPSELDLFDATQRKGMAEAIKAAVGSMPCQLDVDTIVQHAMRVLRSEQSNALWVMLGLSDKWGKWEFDNCNSRKGAIEDWIRDNCMSELSKFMQAEFGEILELKKAEFRKDIRAKIIKDVDKLIGDVGTVPWETKRKFEAVQLETIKEIVQEMREEIRVEVLKSMSIDPARFPTKKETY